MPVHQNDDKPKAEPVVVEKLNLKHADLLGAAAASGDPAVQDLLAHRAIAERNGDEDGIKEIDKKLADFFK